MDAWLEALFANMHWSLLGLTIVVSLYIVGKAADWLVDEAVELSERSHIPKTVVGATVVSLGTTTPEVAVSVLAAMNGSPGLALGNAVGSVICDTGLILGIACLIAPLKLDQPHRQSPRLDSVRGGIRPGRGLLSLDGSGAGVHRRRATAAVGWFRLLGRLGRLHLAVDPLGQARRGAA